MAKKKIKSHIEFLHTNETVHERIVFPNQLTRDEYYTRENTGTLIIQDTNFKQKGASIFVKGNADKFKYNYLRTANKRITVDGTTTDTQVGRYYYYFITDVLQVNFNTVRIDVALDVIGTYLHDMNLSKQVFCERFTPKENNFGENIVPEYYELGEHRTVWAEKMKPCGGDYGYMVAAAECPDNGGTFACKPSYVNGIYNGLSFFYFKQSESAEFQQFLEFFNVHGHIDAVSAIFPFPAFEQITRIAKKTASWKNGTSKPISFRYIGNVVGKELSENFELCSVKDAQELNLSIKGGYKPVCKKLLQYPYTFYSLDNFSGGSRQFRPENLGNGGKLMVKMDTCISIPPSMEFYLTNYNESDQVEKQLSINQSVILGGYGLCCWVSDYAKTWLAQNEDTMNAAKINTLNSFAATMENSQRAYGTSVVNTLTSADTSETIAANNYNMASAQNEYNYTVAQANTAVSGFKHLTGIIDSPVGTIANMTGDAVQAMTNIGDKTMQDAQNRNSLANSLLGTKTNKENALRAATTDYTNAANMAQVSKDNALRSLMASQKAIQSMPSSVRGDTSSNHLDLIRGNNYVFFKCWQGDRRFMERLDKYFQMYGYAENNFKYITELVKDRTTSAFFEPYKITVDGVEKTVDVGGCEYVKTVGADFSSKTHNNTDIVPQIYVDAINAIFDTGIRFWHNVEMNLGSAGSTDDELYYDVLADSKELVRFDGVISNAPKGDGIIQISEPLFKEREG